VHDPSRDQHIQLAKLPRVPARTTPGFVFSIAERMLHDCLGTRRFRSVDMHEVLAFFNDERARCVYCGSQNVARWDHLVPVMKGGETVLGNMVPSCARCDDSKRDLPFDEWLAAATKPAHADRRPDEVAKRIDRIQEYVARYAFVVRPLEDRLTADEQSRLRVIRKRLMELRREVDELIGDYRQRTGAG